MVKSLAGTHCVVPDSWGFHHNTGEPGGGEPPCPGGDGEALCPSCLQTNQPQDWIRGDLEDHWDSRENSHGDDQHTGLWLCSLLCWRAKARQQATWVHNDQDESRSSRDWGFLFKCKSYLSSFIIFLILISFCGQGWEWKILVINVLSIQSWLTFRNSVNTLLGAIS